MGGAIARAVCKATEPENVFLANRTAAKAEALAAELGCQTATNAEVAGNCDLIFLAVKPQMMEPCWSPCGSSCRAHQAVRAVHHGRRPAGGRRIQEMAGGDYPVIPHHAPTPPASGRAKA